jgi:ankyrin repeat protein
MGFLSSVLDAAKEAKAFFALRKAVRANDYKKVVELLGSSTISDMKPGNRALWLGGVLLDAAPEGNVCLVVLLLAHKPNLNQRHAKSGDTALTLAAFRGQDEIVQILIQAGSNVNIANKAGVSPLMLAAAKCRVETIQSLLDRGANLSATSADGMAAVDFAQYENRSDVVSLLNRAGQLPRP